jgi:Fibronectin type III domain
LAGSLLAGSLLSGCGGGSGTSASAAQPTANQPPPTPPSPPPPMTGTATLSWQAPTTNTDGSPLTNLSGYVIYYGTSASNLGNNVQITTVGIQTYVVENLAAGTWYFAVKAVTSTGVESALSAIVAKTI